MNSANYWNDKLEKMLKNSISVSFFNHQKMVDKESRYDFGYITYSSSQGTDIPIIIDSLEFKIPHDKAKMCFNKNLTINEILPIIIKEVDLENSLLKTIRLGTESGNLLNNNDTLDKIYMNYHNREDCILYLAITTQKTSIGYLFSILKYIKKCII